jgi:pSer/pThr/pTyr-binding forkhead associated (FHA) protein
MNPARTALLFAPPRPPLALPEQGTLVLGRSRSCDLTIVSPDASRRHAEIVCAQGRPLLRDLGSTNGTFVNGQRIREHQLATGDRIEIGGDLVTFCEIDPALDAAEAAEGGEAQTRMTERPALGECIRGSLAEIPPFAVLQMLEMGRKAGVLEVDEGEIGPARLWLVDGAPVHAETKGQRGFDAAISIVNAASGRFSFEPGRAAPEHTIRASATELLLEASRHLDEGL